MTELGISWGTYVFFLFYVEKCFADVKTVSSPSSSSLPRSSSPEQSTSTATYEAQ